MDEKELIKVTKKIAEIVKNSEIDPQNAVEELGKIIQETENSAGKNSLEYYNAVAMAHEAMGDVWLKAKKVVKAERAYLEMVKMSVKLFELDREKFDDRLGFSYYKRAEFYRNVALQMTQLTPEPKKLTDQQKKIFELTEGLYKNAVACTMEHAKKGMLRYVELHAMVMRELVILYASVGDYEKAIACGKDCVKLEKAIYQKTDDKDHSFRLANRMNALATVYLFVKNTKLAMETLEDSIFVLEEHEEEDRVVFGLMLARNYLSLANCYAGLKEEASKAEATYQQGLRKMVEANQKTNNRFINDVITSYMIVGDYYKRMQKEETAKAHYRWVMEQASDLWGATKNPVYEGIIKRLTPFV